MNRAFYLTYQGRTLPRRDLMTHRSSPMLALLLSACLLLGCEAHEVTAIHPDEGSRAGNVQPAADYEAALTVILQQVVTNDGLVRYDRLRGDLNPDFRRVLKAVEDFDPAKLTTENARLAFWLNAYNVQMLQNIIATPEVENIVEDGYSDAFFKTPYRTAGVPMTLDEIENVILRRQDGRGAVARYKVTTLDPRIHVGLNCAAVSCPRLRKRAFTAENVDAELDAAMRDFTASPRHFRVEGEQFVLSSLLDWFGPDFDSTGKPAGDFLLGFMPDTRTNYSELAALFKGRTSAMLKARQNVAYDYRWTVNDAG